MTTSRTTRGALQPTFRLALTAFFFILSASAVFLGSGASAQVEPTKFPAYRTIDEAHVDVASTSFFWEMTDVSIGPEDAGLSHVWTSADGAIPPIRDGWAVGLTSGTAVDCGLVNVNPPVRQISHLTGSTCFEVNGDGSFTNISGDGAALSLSGTTYTFTARDGTTYTINGCQVGRIIQSSSSVIFPDGRRVDVLFDGFCRIRTVVNSLGWRLQYSYESDDPSDPDRYFLRRVQAYNGANLACAYQTANCTLSSSWPRTDHVRTSTTSLTTYTVTDAAGRATRFSMRKHPVSPARVTEVRLPSSSGADNIQYRQCPGDESSLKECTTTVYPCFGCPGESYTIQNFVISATVDGDTWTYGLVYPNQYIMIRDSDTPTGLSRMARAEPPGPLDLFASEQGSYNLSGNAQNRLMSFASPEGWTAAYTYDARGNVTEAKYTPSGTTDPVTYERASYPTTCPAAERRRCNRPMWLEDRNGNRTDFTYSIDHGGVLTETGPAVGGILRQVRYEYQQRYARYLDGSGAVIQSPAPVWVRTKESMCRSGAPATPPATGCAVANDELVTEYDYGPTSGVNNLLLRGRLDDVLGLALRTCYGYDQFGNLIAETPPNAQRTSCP